MPNPSGPLIGLLGKLASLQTSRKEFRYNGSDCREIHWRWYLPALAWVAPAQAWASSSANYLARGLSANPSAAQGQFGNLIFGFAVTEALGIFSLLIALLLLFAL